MSSLPWSSRRRPADDKIDLTPMLDVVFILLIFFVVTTVPFDEYDIPLESQLPPPEQPLSEDIPDNILIALEASGRVLFNGEPVDARAVRPRIALVLARNPDAAVIIRPQAQSLAEVLVAVADAARLAGVENIRVSE